MARLNTKLKSIRICLCGNRDVEDVRQLLFLRVKLAETSLDQADQIQGGSRMPIKPFIRLALLAITLLLTAACGTANTPAASQSAPADVFSLPKNTQGYVDISVDQLKSALAHKDFTMINVHIPYEGELPQTDAFIPYNEIEANLSQLPADKNARVLLYCRSGRMSDEAAGNLVKLGYTNIVEVDGGMQAWQAAGNELITK
jgi:rhodanese-related sulfurtransferase